jgi:hypothetical protein
MECGGNLLAGERTEVLAHDRVEEVLGVPVAAHGIPEMVAHDVESVSAKVSGMDIYVCYECCWNAS